MRHHHDYDDISWNAHDRTVAYPYTANVSISRGVLVVTGVSEATTAADAVRFACADAKSRWRGLLVIRGRKGAASPTGVVEVSARVFSDAPAKRAGKPTRTMSCKLIMPTHGNQSFPTTGSFTADLVKPLYDLALAVR
ncbi:MAG: hypothetical protein IPK85_01505 [Gemmatimonadetes bacterium]|nr:hypothetical protein [Gemmatimonadota bacterium]